LLNKVLLKIQKNGFRWFFWRLQREVRNPTNPFLKVIIDKLLYFLKTILKIWATTKKDDFLYAIYDLDVSPITFNITELLIDAEYEAAMRNKKGFVLVFVPSSNDPLLTYKPYDSVIDAASKQWRFQNLVIPVTFLSEKCKGINILPQRSDVINFAKGREVYPTLYDGVNIRGVDIEEFFAKLSKPYLFKGLRAPKQGLKYIQSWVSENNIKEPIVTITIRNYMFDKARNSNIEAWSKFAIYLRSAGYHPVVIPETDTAFCEDQQFDGITIFRDCAWNIGLRASLYEFAFQNLFVSNGCVLLAVFNPTCKYILMNFQAEESIVAVEENFKKMGIQYGDNYKFATPGQVLNYTPDTFENIVFEFEKFLKDHEARKTNEPSLHSDKIST
jgi:hypothetical protein